MILLIAAAGAFAAVPAGARPHPRDQNVAFEATQQGRLMPLREIEALIVPRMRGADYLGPELYPESGRYRLKFRRGEHVIWIDVDGRTGRVIGKTGD
jgi:hypothetical protein